jgi:hypothetical protein
MECLTNLMKIIVFHVRTYHSNPLGLLRMLYSYNFADIDAISETLGIPWKHSKDLLLSFSIIYIRFYWDLKTSTVSLTLAKQEKYLLAIWDGTPDLFTPSTMWKNYMGSFYTPVLSSLEDVPIFFFLLVECCCNLPQHCVWQPTRSVLHTHWFDRSFTHIIEKVVP